MASHMFAPLAQVPKFTPWIPGSLPRHGASGSGRNNSARPVSQAPKGHGMVRPWAHQGPRQLCHSPHSGLTKVSATLPTPPGGSTVSQHTVPTRVVASGYATSVPAVLASSTQGGGARCMCMLAPILRAARIRANWQAGHSGHLVAPAVPVGRLAHTAGGPRSFPVPRAIARCTAPGALHQIRPPVLGAALGADPRAPRPASQLQKESRKSA